MRVEKPVKPLERLQFVDILRGFALFGVLAANMTSFSGYDNNPLHYTDFMDVGILVAIQFLIRAKFYSLFSFLFGWGTAVQMGRAAAKGGRFEPVFVRRMIILLIFGLIHGLVIWSGDILTLYAVLGLALLLFRKSSARILLIAAGLFLLFNIILNLPVEAMDHFRQWYAELTSFMRQGNLPNSVLADGGFLIIVRKTTQDFWAAQSWFIYYIGGVFSMFLLGLYTGKRRIFENVAEDQPLLRRTAIVGLIIGVIFNAIFVWNTLHPDWLSPEYGRFVGIASRTIGAPALMLFYVAGLTLLTRRQIWYTRLLPLANVGRMALSNYIMQSIVCVLIFYGYGLGLYGKTDPTFGMIVTILLFTAQIHLSRRHLENHQFGLLEWLWRTLTYGKRQPWHKNETYETLPPIPVISAVHRMPPIAKGGLLLLLLALAAGTLFFRSRGVENTTAISLPLSARATATPAPALDPETVLPTSTPAPIATPQVQAAAYEPQAVARTGNMVALAETFDPAQALEYIKTLSGPPYNGRRAGSTGGLAAGDYLAEQFAALGLQPAGDEGTFFQTFPISYTNLAEAPQMTVTLADGTPTTYHVFEDFSPVVHDFVGDGRAAGEVLWLNECSHEDFGLLNVLDKIVLCRPTGAPGSYLQANRSAIEHGAGGLLLLTYPDQRPADMGDLYMQPWIPEPIPALRVYPEMVDQLFLGSGTTITEALLLEQPLPLAAQVELEVKTLGDNACPIVEEASGCTGRNVLGVLPGRDPDFAHEVVIIGAHYDHLGDAPAGEGGRITWAGANDDASGTAVLLEIARTWQEQGYVPRRTVMFAAWDAEELSLLGSTHYVEDPRYPPGNVVAELQMDMVGAGGDILYVDGEPGLVSAIAAAAEGIDYPLQQINLGRSDHVPFLNAGIPAALLIWLDEDGQTTPHYHRPADTPEVIDLDKLETVGELAAKTALNLVESEPAMLAMLQERAAAVSANDLDSFITTSAAGQEAVDTAWFADLQARSPLTVTISTVDLQIQGDQATAVAAIEAAYPLSSTLQTVNGTLPVRFSRNGNGWQWAGPDLQEISGSGVTIRFPAGLEDDLSGLPAAIRGQYDPIAAALGLETGTPIELQLFPDAGSLRSSTALFLPENQRSWVAPSLVRLVYTKGISETAATCRDSSPACPTDALVHLALANGGVSAEEMPWLWQGLPIAWQAESNSVGVQSAHIPQLQAALANDTPIPPQTAAWAATTYAIELSGWDGLLDWLYSDVWQDAWRSRLTAAQTALDNLLQERTQAILARDEAAFLESAVPQLAGAQQRWLADLEENPVSSFSQTAVPLAFLEDGSLLARVTMNYELSGRGPSSAEMDILFAPQEDGYLWAGKNLQELAGETAVVRFPDGFGEQAGAKLAQLEAWIPQLSAVFNISPTLPLEVELYDAPDDMRAAIALPYHATNWTEPGQPLKLQASSDDGVLITQLTRQLLGQAGVSTEWLLRGTSAAISSRFDGGATQARLSGSWPVLTTAAGTNTLLDLNAIAPELAMSQEDNLLAHLQSWDAVRTFIDTEGWLALLAQMTSARPIASPAFQEAWQDSLARAHIQPAWLELSAAFDANQAMQTINDLTAPELNGRLAGSSGAEKAALTIAEGFRAAGLQPAGDRGTFFQTVPLTISNPIGAPQFELTTPSGAALPLLYREEFLTVQPTIGGEPLSGNLFYVQKDADYGNANFEGGIVVRNPSFTVAEEIQLAQDNGASALILTSFKREVGDLYDKQFVAVPQSGAVPVLELTDAGHEKLLAAFDIQRNQINNLLPIQPLDGSAVVHYAVTEPQQRATSNVLAFLPGSDPFLGQEIIIAGAHYDYVGDDANGRTYSGANDAAGVAALLEIARMWQEAGYRPQRSILFAAWGAQELGNLGSASYVANPTRPLADTIALVQIEGVGGGGGFNLGAEGIAARDSRLLGSLETAVGLLGEKLVIAPHTTASDLSSFDTQGFPSLLISWRLAGDTNLPDDIAFPVKAENLQLSGQAAALLLMSLAQ